MKEGQSGANAKRVKGKLALIMSYSQSRDESKSREKQKRILMILLS